VVAVVALLHKKDMLHTELVMAAGRQMVLQVQLIVDPVVAVVVTMQHQPFHIPEVTADQVLL
jgi:hypothetical protein